MFKKKSGDPESSTPAQPVLHKIKTTPDKATRRRMIKELVETETVWSQEVLLGCLDDPCEDNREFVIQALGSREDLDLNRVCAQLRVLPWYVKSAALRVLGMKKEPWTVSHIGGVITDSNTDVRIQAAWALGEIGGDASLALLARLTKDRNNFVKQSARKALQKASQLRFS
jgi:HEAT repeat protein